MTRLRDEEENEEGRRERSNGENSVKVPTKQAEEGLKDSQHLLEPLKPSFCTRQLSEVEADAPTQVLAEPVGDDRSRLLPYTCCLLP